MVPRDQEVKAVVCFCHGYAGHIALEWRREYARFVRQGVAVVTIEYEGHGRSDGQLGLIYDWDHLIDDTSTFFQQVTTQKFPGKKVFLMGEVRGHSRSVQLEGYACIVLTIFLLFTVHGRRRLLLHLPA